MWKQWSDLWPLCCSVATIDCPGWRWWASMNSDDTSAYTSSKASPTTKRIPSSCSSASPLTGAVGDCCCCCCRRSVGGGAWWRDDDGDLAALSDAALTKTSAFFEEADITGLDSRRWIMFYRSFHSLITCFSSFLPFMLPFTSIFDSFPYTLL